LLTIDLSALAANYRDLAARAKPAECAAVVKADAYGIGLEPAAAASPGPKAASAASGFARAAVFWLMIRLLTIQANLSVSRSLWMQDRRGAIRAAPGTAPAREARMIRKLKGGKYRLYSRKRNPKTGRRRNLGTFATRAAAEKHERAVQYFKRGG